MSVKSRYVMAAYPQRVWSVLPINMSVKARGTIKYHARERKKKCKDSAAVLIVNLPVLEVWEKAVTQSVNKCIN